MATGSDNPAAAVRQTALNLLARREHSSLELQHKLNQRGFDADAVQQVLATLIREGWLSDQRFAEIYAGQRADKGYGPLRIASELRQRGVDRDIVDSVLLTLDHRWMPRLERLFDKRFDRHSLTDGAARMRCLRFLRHRGYPMTQIDELFREKEQ